MRLGQPERFWFLEFVHDVSFGFEVLRARRAPCPAWRSQLADRARLRRSTSAPRTNGLRLVTRDGSQFPHLFRIKVENGRRAILGDEFVVQSFVTS